MGKIALILNHVDDAPDALEKLLEAKGHEVAIFDIQDIRKEGERFLMDNTPIDPNGYAMTIRIVQGGTSGHTQLSRELQQAFVDQGATPHTTAAQIAAVTDKIRCKQELTGLARFPSIALGEQDALPSSEALIEKLGEPPYAVRKSLGSGKDSVVTAPTSQEALEEIQKYRDKNCGALIHALPPMLDKPLVEKYELGTISEPEKRSHHFRVAVVDGQVFGVNICYSEPAKFGLNISQGAEFKPINPIDIGMDALELARNAANKMGLKLAAIDIAFIGETPRVLDMNPSPDLRFENTLHETLREGLADSVHRTLRQITTAPSTAQVPSESQAQER